MSGLGDILSFEGFNLKEIGKKIKDNPERLLIGAIDPASTKVWNKALGKDYEPMVDQWGGASADTYSKAEAAGIDTNAGHSMHRLARVVAGSIAGGYGLSQLNGGASAAGNPSSLVDGGSAGQGLSSADKAALFGDGGYGPGMSGQETSAYDAAIDGGKKFGLSDLQRMQAQMPRQQETHLRDVEYESPDLSGYMDTTVASSRTLKTPRSGMGLGDALSRGIRGEDPVDSNGVEVAAIKELDQRMDRLLARITKMKGAAQ